MPDNIRKIIQDRKVHYLTGLPNAGGYIDEIHGRIIIGTIKEYTAFLFNLKGFSNINQKYGIEAADSIVIRFSEKVKEFLDEDEVLGHLGGDNFVALVRKCRKEKFCRLLNGIEVTFTANGKEEKVRIPSTIGLWDIEENFDDPGEAISRPSIALQHAKHILHVPVVSVTEEMIKRVAVQKTVLEQYQSALQNQEFLVFYQPKVDSRNNTLVGAEGLVRWNHDGQMISPGIFIPPLEQNGEIYLLDFYVLKKTCEDIKKWMDNGFEPVTISVNFSRKDMVDPDLAANIDRIIINSGIDKKYIEVELTETVDEQEHGELAKFISDLRERGINTAIDDFGAGYSSLATLREFEVHTLKIDRSFINTPEFSWKDKIILTDIIHMASELGMEVITEGVERQDQIDFVNKVGCYIIQGYYYDRPLPLEEFEERLKNKVYNK
ncbi:MULTISPECIES: putative bifunctional diguanylate cyclase/phosphodiesterase [unclassified Butyrivibrio]|uniref:putative bifunctional diguanylate cyclase/phosphodiesterase n=1 Tax=unclassified Butyrivibrio TaxID=2639466 RepID=UPI00041C0F58|nr:MULTISPECIES: GGDEF domain-containing phosphodiesterase [unclassified Butyrivibrio]